MIHGELIVDNFAGGGGASTGIEIATGYSVDIAINHDPEAIKMHKANHPNTKHYCENVWSVDPVKACNGHPVGLAWFSPDCKHFSKAKGGKPKDKNIRGLAWVALRWAGLVRPRVIMLENVEEFKTWGPLNRGHHPIKAKQIRKAYESKQIQESRHNMTELEPRQDNISNTMTTVQKDNLLLENNIQKVGQISSDGSQRGTVISDNGISANLVAGTHGYANSHIATKYRIRKLTPRECGRLMGVSDEDISKMAAVNSNTQLYKQFGNSIVVDVMCAMFRNLNIEQEIK